jgi:Lysylphosphatidylglycerol synthase TM region
LSRLKKLKHFLNYFLGPLLFAGIGYSIYRQLSHEPKLSGHWQHIKDVINGGGKGYLMATLALMMVNWGLESKKWQILTSHVQPTSFWTAIKSVMAGVSFTMLTPNRMGEFLGRVLFLPDGSRIRAATLMVLSSLSQLVITLLCGVAGVLALMMLSPEIKAQTLGWSNLLVNSLLYGSFLVILIGLFIYFNIGWFIRQIEKLPAFSKYAYYMHIIGEIHYVELLKILSISILRYSVFLVQYALVFQFFEVGIPILPLVAGTAVMFLMLAIIPTIALVELGVRGQVSLFVFGLFSNNSLEILVATAVIWIINIIFPAVAGSFMLLTVKLFRKT